MRCGPRPASGGSIKSDLATSATPVIMLTSTDDPREVERCYRFGCNVSITKLVDYDGCINAIKQLGLFLQVVRVPRNGRGAAGEGGAHG